MRIDSSGNVGINESSPNDKLVVNGAITQKNTSTDAQSSQLFLTMLHLAASTE